MKLSCLGHAFFVFWIRLVQMKQILRTCLRRIKWKLNKSETFNLGAFSTN